MQFLAENKIFIASGALLVALVAGASQLQQMQGTQETQERGSAGTIILNTAAPAGNTGWQVATSSAVPASIQAASKAAPAPAPKPAVPRRVYNREDDDY
ncbi:MAG: hypothetical protein KGH79_04075 [Patescibacteria group bacterium]|nr:hypothetical protein [Patescibacteria group bacterium]